jgi:galactokinase
VNLIGEYTDFNGGLVLPLAIDRYLFVAAVPRTDRLVLAKSEATSESITIDLDGIGAATSAGLDRYVRGMASCLMSLGLPLVGAELRITGDLPGGAGLSSSAALEVAIGHALWALSGVAIDARALALAALRCEQEYVGTQCGPMDQFAVSLGVADHALRIDCRSLDVTPVRLSLGNAELLVCDTGVTHALSDSAYNERRAQCEEAVRILAPHVPGLHALCDLDEAAFLSLQHLLPETLRARARHVTSEHARVERALAALRDGDLAVLGRLLLASHASLRDDFAVSCPELDLLVDIARDLDGVHGGRMTGAGFGGSAIFVVDSEARPRVEAELALAYRARFGRSLTSFTVLASGGTCEVTGEGA